MAVESGVEEGEGRADRNLLRLDPIYLGALRHRGGRNVLAQGADQLVDCGHRLLLVVHVCDERHLGDEETLANVEGGLPGEEREDVIVERDPDLTLDLRQVAVEAWVGFGGRVPKSLERAGKVVEVEVDER